ncbi:helix-turn-helix domain-containing protein [Streptomyces sp. NPDC008222]|uniref:helix-turn-helix domain-containing protein n=1 Tax=Streptomyces sp. NPDC008222 TaxID=3364820 RepID=UPI0036E2B8FA
MRYPQGGGLTAERQAFRERVRMEAAVMFAEGRGSTDIARELRVSVRSVQRWRQAWKVAGRDGVRSRGPASKPKLGDALFAVLEEELSKGPVAHGWPDQRWTLARIKTAFTDPSHLIRRLRHGLRQIQYRSDIIDGCLTGTGLTPTTPRLQRQ